MSHFLRQLVQRSLAPAAVGVQPRLASRFELPAAAPKRFSEEHSETVAPAAALTAPTAPAARAEFSSSVSPVANPPPFVSPLAASSTPALTASLAPHSPTTISAPTSLFAPAPPPTSAPSPSARSVAISNLSPREPSPTAVASTNTLLIERVTERVREILPTPVAPISPSATPAVSPRDVFAPAPAPAAAAAPLSASVSPAIALPPAPAPAAPTVRVTIGRVDIRAIHAPPAAPARAPVLSRPPLVSLENYLNQRDAK